MARSRIEYPWADAPSFGETVEVGPGIEWTRLPFARRPGHVNAYILEDAGEVTIVDTGIDDDATRGHWRDALRGRPVARVVATHHHPDHIGLAGWFAAREGAEIWTTRTAWLMARMQVLDVREAPSPELQSYWRALGMGADEIADRLGERPFNYADVVAPLPARYRRLAEGSMPKLAGRWWHLWEGHGHAPEHATLWSEDGDIVLMGDQVMPRIPPSVSLPPTEIDADPLADWLSSCEQMYGLATPGHLVLPGHERPFRGLTGRLRDLVEDHRASLRRLLAYLETPRTASDCVSCLFRVPVAPSGYEFALSEAASHCLFLWHVGDVTRTIRGDGAWVFEARADAGAPVP